ncbi:MAG: hypothetical protein K6U74_08000 [Firmicutes bacterium]|nr:hypothetical protein [Bacillota bacterium]
MGGIYPYWWNFLLYCPADDKAGMAEYFLRRMPGVKPIGRADFERVYRGFESFGDISTHYIGFKEIYNNFVLLMTWPSGRGAGFLVFKPKSTSLIEVDILVLQEELRGLGLGLYMYGVFESACEDGALLFVVSVTGQGRKFFARCGFQRDIDFFKVLAVENRVAEPFSPETEE